MNSISRRARSLAMAMGWILLQGSLAGAAVVNWNINSSGVFDTAANWDHGAPTTSDTATFRRGNSVSYTVSFAGTDHGFPILVYTIDRLVVGSNIVSLARQNVSRSTSLVANNATTTASGRGIVVGELATDTATLNTSLPISGLAATIADGTGSVGTWNVNSGSVTLSNNGGGGIADSHSLIIGNSGNGALNIAAGASVTSPGAFALAIAANSTGTVNVGGVGATISAGLLNVGYGGTGSLNIARGASVTSVSGTNHIGENVGSVGNVSVDGAGSSWLAEGDGRVFVGLNGNGKMEITNGGQVSDSEGNLASGSGYGQVTVDGAGSSWSNGTVQIGGGSGVGYLSISGGGSVQSQSGFIYSGGATVSGVGSTWTNSGNFGLEGSGLVSLTITAGGQVIDQQGFMGFVVGPWLSLVTIDGVGSSWTNNGDLQIGTISQAIINVTGGGHLVGKTNAVVGTSNQSSGTVTLDGTGSLWSQVGNITVGSGGLGSALVVRNGGAVTVGGTLTIGAKGTLKGDGTITGNVSNSGHVAPGDSLGILHIVGNYTQTASGTLDVELAGTVPGTQYDKLVASGLVSLLGTVNVTLASTFTPAAGQSFDVADWGTLTTESVTFNLPALSASLTWNTTQFLSSGVISVVGSAVPGDYNGNGIVDTADYVVWRDTLGSTTDLRANGDNTGASAGKIDQADYIFWRTNFGNHAGSGASAAAVVPEPQSLVLSILAVVGWFVLKHRATHRSVILVNKRSFRSAP